MASMVTGANYRADSSELEWKQPFNPDTASMPVHFSSGTTPSLIVELKKDFSTGAGDITWYRKQASDTSWTQIESEPLEAKWDHNNAKSSSADYNAQTFFPEEGGSLATLNEGESQTVTINGVEHTFEASDITPAGSPPAVALTVDGTIKTITEGEYIEVENQPVRADEITEDDVGNERVELDLYNDQLNPGDGNWEYKVEAETSSGEFYHSKPIYFDISGFNNDNRPYIENVTINGQSIYEFESLSGINPGATVTADVIEREGDSYNVTLQDRSGGSNLEVHEIPVNEDGSIENVYSLILDFAFAPFFDTAGLKGDNSNRVAFKILPEERENAVDLFGVSGTYDFGFKVEDYGNDATLDGKRLTNDFTLTTDDTVLEPNITSVEGSGDCTSYSQLSDFNTQQNLNCIKVTATDENDDDLFVAMNLTETYDGIDRNTYSRVANNYHLKNGDEYIFNLSNIDVPTNSLNQSGGWKADFIASDGVSNDTKTVSWNVEWGELQFTDYSINGNQGDTEVLKNNFFWANTTIQCINGECASTNETVTIELDPLKNTKKTFQGPIHKGEELSTGIKLTLYDRLSAVATGDSLQ